jgi:hypothetical protein
MRPYDIAAKLINKNVKINLKAGRPFRPILSIQISDQRVELGAEMEINFEGSIGAKLDQLIDDLLRSGQL